MAGETFELTTLLATQTVDTFVHHAREQFLRLSLLFRAAGSGSPARRMWQPQPREKSTGQGTAQMREVTDLRQDAQHRTNE